MNKEDEKRKQIDEDNEVDPCDTCQYRKDRTRVEAKADNFLGDTDGDASSPADGSTDSSTDSLRPPFSESECRQRCKRSFWTEFLRTVA